MPILPDAPNDEFKRFVYEQFSRIGKALSSSARLVIMNVLSQGEHTVEALARYADMNVANISRHLQVLRGANLVKIRREGKYIHYAAADEDTVRFYHDFKNFAYNQLLEIRSALQEISKSPSRLHPVNREGLLKKISEDHVLIVDVRPEEEYKQGHLPGAISMPLQGLEKRLRELPQDKLIVAFCRGRFCILADKAVDIFLANGYSAQRADDGVADWKIAGLPIEN